MPVSTGTRTLNVMTFNGTSAAMPVSAMPSIAVQASSANQ